MASLDRFPGASPGARVEVGRGLLAIVFLVTLLAVSIGGISGYAVSERVLARVYIRNAAKIAASAAFGEVYGQDNEVEFMVIGPKRYIPPLAAAGLVTLGTLVFSGLFAAGVLKAEPIQVLTQKESEGIACLLRKIFWALWWRELIRRHRQHQLYSA